MTETQSTYTIPDIRAELERGPQWLRDRRRHARDRFNATPVPPRGLHLWRYTDPSRFLVDLEASDSAFDAQLDAVEKLERKHFEDGSLAALAIDYGARNIEIHLSEPLRKLGVVVSTLSDAAKSHGDLLQKYLYQLVNSETGKFEAMNGALWNDGLFVYVPANKTVEKPIHLLREAGLAGSSTFSRLLIVLGQNAEATFVDEYAGGGASETDGLAYSNGAVELFGEQDSRTRYILVQRQQRGTVSYLTHRARIEKGATMMTIPLSFGGLVSKQNFGVILNGEGAHSRMFGLLFGAGRQQFDNHTLHEHAAGNTNSDIDFKVVLRDQARSAYTGLISIDHHAKTCEAYQENRNLLLNKGTRAETIPELEILNEDVSCSHGATVGPIDQMQLFYLRSRGIAREQAIRMIVSGFVASTIAMAPADLQDRITTVINDRLEDL